MKKIILVLGILLIALFLFSCAKEDLAGEAMKKIADARPDKGFEIKINVKDSFSVGEQIGFDYEIYSPNNAAIKYVANYECEDAPFPTEYVEEIELKTGKTIKKTYSKQVVEESFEPQACLAYVKILEPVEKKLERDFRIEADPSFDIKLKLCNEDEPCFEHYKVFLKGEELYLGWESEVENFEFTAKLIDPNGYQEDIAVTRPYSLDKTGTYTILFDAQKIGYKDVSQKVEFAVIDKHIPVVEKSFKGDPPMTGSNTKDMSQFSTKEVFLVSDEDWHDVLKLVPVTAWTDGDNILYYPTMVYHRDGSAFDIDSIVYFMQQYNTEKVTIVDSAPQSLIDVLTADPPFGVGLDAGQVQTVSPSNLKNYWSSYDTVVYAYDNYEYALPGAVLASYHNAPLVIQGDSFSFTGKDVIVVGYTSCPSGAATCTQFTSKNEILGEYYSLTNTNKLMLVNHDLDNFFETRESLNTDKCSQNVNNLYGRTSLAGAFLAAAKQELIISYGDDYYYYVDNNKNNTIANLNIDNAEYLTIVAAPKEIDTYYVSNSDRMVTDSWHYAKIDDDDSIADLAVGRIYGITVSDASSLIARSLFYDDILINENNAVTTVGASDYYMPADAYTIGKILEIIGYDVLIDYVSNSDPEYWENTFYLQEFGHGNAGWAGIGADEIPLLDNTFLVIQSCNTCDYNAAGPKWDLFCMQAVRQGAIGYIGGIDVTYYWTDQNWLSEIFGQGNTIGKAFMNAKTGVALHDILLRPDIREVKNEMSAYILIGDPTFKIRTNHMIPSYHYDFVSQDSSSLNLDLVVPAINITIPQEVIDLCAWDNFRDALFASVLKSELMMKYRFMVRDENIFNAGDITSSYWDMWLETMNEKDFLWLSKYCYVDCFQDGSETFQDYHFPITLEVSGSLCSDGTPYNMCSADKPKYCDGSGNLLDNYCFGPDQIPDNSDDCGCPVDESCLPDGSCLEGPGGDCDDGTLNGVCSVTKPLYCDAGTLIDDCVECECPVDMFCQADGRCAHVPWDPIFDLDCDGSVGGVDFAMFASVYNAVAGVPGTLEYCADFDGLGKVDGVDFAMFAAHFLTSGSCDCCAVGEGYSCDVPSAPLNINTLELPASFEDIVNENNIESEGVTFVYVADEQFIGE